VRKHNEAPVKSPVLMLVIRESDVTMAMLAVSTWLAMCCQYNIPVSLVLVKR
jgi:hypothetical protein